MEFEVEWIERGRVCSVRWPTLEDANAAKRRLLEQKFYPLVRAVSAHDPRVIFL